VRLEEILAYPWEDPDARRLVKRMRKYREDLFRFLDDPNVPPDNNHAEREIRPAVIIRKNSLCNRSEEGAQVQAVLMSVYRTLKLRGADPIRTIASALREYVLTGALPPLPPAPASLG
jgi:transposase